MYQPNEVSVEDGCKRGMGCGGRGGVQLVDLFKYLSKGAASEGEEA